jgi:hypothetical protein
MIIIGSRRWLSLLFVALALLAPAPAIAGVLFIDDRGAQMLLSNGRLKHVSPSGEEPIVAVDAGRARMWVSNPRTRAYWEGTIDEFCTSVRGLLAGVTGGGGGGMPALSPEMGKMMQERMAGLPPEQQEMIKQMMQAAMARQGQPGAAGAAATPRVTVEPTGETETIAGFSTRKFRVFADGKLHEEVWLTNDPAITREFDPKRAPETIAKLSACRGAQQSRVQDTDPYRQLFTQGWPLRSVAHDGGFSRPNVVRAERKDFADAEFTPPTGFRKLPLMEVFTTR